MSFQFIKFNRRIFLIIFTIVRKYWHRVTHHLCILLSTWASHKSDLNVACFCMPFHEINSTLNIMWLRFWNMQITFFMCPTIIWKKYQKSQYSPTINHLKLKSKINKSQHPPTIDLYKSAYRIHVPKMMLFNFALY